MSRRKKMNRFKVPTGDICIIDGDLGMPLEFLSIGDYGGDKNMKADFLGLTKEIDGVTNSPILPLEKKWVVTVSSQYGCSMGCTFCDVPKVGRGINATLNDIMAQVHGAISLHPEVEKTARMNVHYARMGEPTWNLKVIESAYLLRDELEAKNFGFHPVVSTVMPKDNRGLRFFLQEWLEMKNRFEGEAGLQLSINTTSDEIRHKVMPSAMDIADISCMMSTLLYDLRYRVFGRKITLNFALTDAPIDAKLLKTLFDPRYFLCKITPMHNTDACIKNGLITDNGYDSYYPYKEVEQSLKDTGYDVIVFIPSHEEDDSKITCGNAILATGYKEVK